MLQNSFDMGVQNHVSNLYPEWGVTEGVPKDAPKPGFMGGWAYSVPHKVRYITAPKQLLYDRSPALPSDAARHFVRENYKLPLRRRWDQQREFSMPLYALSGEHGECAYVDMKAAYKTLVERVGYDVDYRRGAYCTVNPIRLPDIFAARKVAYAILVSMSSKVTSALVKLTDDGPATQLVFNRFANVCLFAYCTDVMASCAAEALRRFPIFYVHTDGYILPARYGKLFQEFLSEWGFRSSVKAEGDTLVTGVGAWSIGARSTKRQGVFSHDFRSRLPDLETAGVVKKMLQKQLTYDRIRQV